ncbi:FAD-dependent monooxygenase [Amycolatopsis minnesotensis]|uniref:FAD-dependent monooxygenase n=1 Tax=Amycolatopsis minnesotensis TaxID=337894 RepID=A0ABN2SQD0_9PSEU
MTSRGTEYDVVIAGAGPTGLTLACELRLAGVRVLVLERLTELDPTLKAGSINVPTAEAFYRRGLLPAMHEEQRRGYERMKEFIRSKVPESASGLPPKMPKLAGHFAGIMVGGEHVRFDDPAFRDVGPAGEVMLVPQQAVESILDARARELGVEIRRGVELTGFGEDEDGDGDGVTVRFGDGSVRAGWLVGCDGGRSLVRKTAGFDFPGTDPLITGRQALVDLTGGEALGPGWNRTERGLYVNGPLPGRILTVELDGPPADRDAPITAAELQASLRRVSGVDVTITAVHSATRYTDNARQVPEYRRGRVLLAGDAAHVHSPFGGQGLNLGVGDAMNLGWKLAATVLGGAPDGLLDTYTAERHPIGEWVLEWTRAQVALMRTDVRTGLLRGVVGDLLSTPDGSTYLAKKLSGVLHRYDMGDRGHDWIGLGTPDLAFADGTRLGEHCAKGAFVLLDLADSAELRELVAPWGARIELVTAKAASDAEPSGLLMRPDGHVAWARDGGSLDGLAEALHRWAGAPG